MSDTTGASPTGSYRDLGWLVLLGIIWGSAFPIIRAGLVAGADPLAYGAARFALATVAMAAIAVVQRDRFPGRRAIALWVVLGGFFVVGGYAAFLYTGEEYIAGGFASIFVATAPLWSALLTRLWLKGDRIGPVGLVGLSIGFGGVLVLLLPNLSFGERAAVIGGLLSLSAALAFAIGSVLLRRELSGSTGPWGITMQFVGGATVLGALSLTPLGSPTLPANLPVIATLVWLAIVPSVIGYTIFFGLHHRVGPTRAALVAYVNPAVGVLVGIGLFGEAVTLVEIAGFGLVLVGLLVLQRDRGPSPVAAQAGASGAPGTGAEPPGSPRLGPTANSAGDPPTGPTR